MIARARRSRSTLRVTVALVAACSMLSWAGPNTASADDFWGLWASEITQRTWWEMPFVIVVSFPAMVVTTPFWLGNLGVGAMKGGGSSKTNE